MYGIKCLAIVSVVVLTVIDCLLYSFYFCFLEFFSQTSKHTCTHRSCVCVQELEHLGAKETRKMERELEQLSYCE